MSHFRQAVISLTVFSFLGLAIGFDVSRETAGALAAVCAMIGLACVVYLP